MVKNLLVLTYWSFDDALIQAYTLPYVRIIRKNLSSNSKIFLFTFEKSNQKITKFEWNRIKLQFEKENIHLIRFNYNGFGMAAILMFPFVIARLLLIIFFKKISIIHAWCTPAGAIGYLLSILSGKPLNLDSFEPHAEPMLESHTWKKSGLAFRFLFKMEKLQAKRASNIIFCVDKMKDYCKEKYNLEIGNYFVKPACVDFNKFNYKMKPNPELIQKFDLGGFKICVYSGKFGDSYLTTEVFDFFKICYDFWNGKFKALLISSTSTELIYNYADSAGFPRENIVKVFVDFNDVPEYLALADFAITPFKPVPSKRFGTPIKNGEYWAMGLPVVITKNISDDSEIIEKNEIGAVLNDLNIEEYKNAVFKIDKILQSNSRLEIQFKIITIAKKIRSFELAEDVYKLLYCDDKKTDKQLMIETDS